MPMSAQQAAEPDVATVLIIDRNFSDFVTLRSSLVRDGYKVIADLDPTEAIARLPVIAPDLILLNISTTETPTLDESALDAPAVDTLGLEICAQLLAQPLSSNIPIILITALTDAAGRNTGLKLGAADYLTQPIQPQEALARINLHLRLRQLNQTVTQQNCQIEQLNSTLGQLQQTQEYFRQLAENIDHVFWITNPDKNRMLYVSPGYERIWGRPPAELHTSPQAWLQAIHPDDRDRVIAAFVKQTQCEYNEEYRILRSDGDIRWIRDRAFPICNETGTIYRIAGIAEDITHYKHIQEKLQLQERAITASQNGIVIADARLPDRPVIYVNPAFERITGYQASEIIGHNCRFLQGIDKNQADLITLRAALKAGQGCTVSLRNYRKDGSLFWNELSISPIHDDQGTLTHYIGIQNDVTERKQVEAEREQAEASLRQMLRELEFQKFALDQAAIVAITDHNGTITEANDRFCEISKYSREELLGQTHRLVRSDYHPPSFFQDLWATITSGKVWKGEIQNRAKDGSLYWVDTTIIPLMGSGKRPSRYMAIRFDITIRKQSEHRLQTATLRLATLLQNLQAGILVEDEQRHIVLVNQSFCDLFSISAPPDVLVGTSCDQAAAQLQALFRNPENFINRVGEILAERVTVVEEEITLANERVLERDYVPIFAGDDYRGHLWQYRDITEQKQSKEAVQASNDLLRIISAAQSQFITSVDARVLFDGLLSSLLELTQSEYGFIGEVLFTQDGEPYMEEAYMKVRGRPYMKAHAMTNIAWNDETRALYDQHAAQGMEFHNLHTLFGAVMVTGQAVISNEPSTDPRRGGLPHGHPALNAFLGIPFYNDQQMVGMVGIANRPGGYSEALVSYLQPFLSTCANIIEAYRNDRRRQQAEQSLKQQLAAVEAAIDGIAILDASSQYIYLNSAHVQLFGYDSPADLLGQSWVNLYPPEEVDRFEREVFPVLARNHHWQGEATAKRRDGSTFAEEVSLTLIEGGGLVCVCRDVSDRKYAEEQLKSSLQEKEILLKEIHHRVKNNLLVVSSLLELQTDYINDPRVIKVFAESQTRIQSMALIHEKLYASQNLARIDLSEYLTTLAQQLFYTFNLTEKQVKLHFDIQSTQLNIETVTPCGLIVNELISNVFEHAFPHGKTGEVWLRVHQHSNRQITVQVQDDGVGFPESIDFRNTESFGLQLVCLLAEQLEGNLEIIRHNGTTFNLTFSELHYRQRL